MLFRRWSPVGSPGNDAVRRAQSKQFAVPNAIPSSVFTPDSQHHENPSSTEPTTSHSHPLAAAPAMPVFTAIQAPDAQVRDGSRPLALPSAATDLSGVPGKATRSGHSVQPL